MKISPLEINPLYGTQHLLYRRSLQAPDMVKVMFGAGFKILL